MKLSNNRLVLLIAFLFIGIIFVINIFQVDDSLTIEKENYKEKLFSKKIEKLHSLDETYNIYKNSYYNVSFDGPDNWKSDTGIGVKVIYRTYEKKLGITFTLLADKLKEEQTKYFNTWDFYSKNKEKFQKKLKKGISQGAKSKCYNYRFELAIIKNIRTIKISCNYKMKSINMQTEFQLIIHYILSKKNIYVLNLGLPKELYEDNKLKYEEFFNNIYLLGDPEVL